jgi:hypothetical protein
MIAGSPSLIAKLVGWVVGKKRLANSSDSPRITHAPALAACVR